RAIAIDSDVQVRDALTVGESLVAAMIARACAPRSKRAFADWAKTTYLPDLMHFTSSDLTSQHFWDQMHAVPVEKLALIEQELVQEVVRPEQLTLVFDAGASSRQNLEGLERYVTAVRPSNHLALLSEAADQLAEVELSNGAAVRAWRTQRKVAGKQQDVVVVFSPQLYEGQLRGLRQTLSRSWRELEEMQLHPPKSVEAAKRKVDKIRRHQYLRSLLCYEVTRDGRGPIRIRLWGDWQEY